jgi:hypothetical protein
MNKPISSMVKFYFFLLILFVPFTSKGQTISDSLYSIEQSIEEFNKDIMATYNDNRIRFYQYMVEHFPVGSGTYDMHLSFGSILNMIDQVIYDIRILRVNHALKDDSTIPEDLKIDKEKLNATIESWRSTASYIKSTENHLTDEQFYSYTIPPDIMRDRFIPSVTRLIILLNQSSRNIQNASDFLESEYAKKFD